MFIAYTCGFKYRDYAKATVRRLVESGANYMGSCYCRGLDTFGLLGKIGGIAKGHPDKEDLDKILESLEKFVKGNA